jgi:hypothetical protein
MSYEFPPLVHVVSRLASRSPMAATNDPLGSGLVSRIQDELTVLARR